MTHLDNPDLTPEQNAYLFEEPSNLLKQELREPAVYNAIITAIAEGHTRMSEIASKVGMESSACSKYSSVLLSLGILSKVTPVTEKPGRKTLYKVSDPCEKRVPSAPANSETIKSDMTSWSCLHHWRRLRSEK